MVNEAFVLGLAVVCVFLLVWACKTLPAEQWQILASIPITKDESGRWQGINLTYYGLLTANAAVVAVALLCILMTAIGVPLIGILTVVTAEILVCLPAAKLVARMVEGKECTFTVGGAFFVGLLVAPWLVAVVNATIGSQWGFSMPIPATLAAVVITYAFGEGLGRLACISFGCCYGRPLSQLPPFLRRSFTRWHFVFFGKTKKIAYASKMEGERVLPIQALTAVLYLATGLVATLLLDCCVLEQSLTWSEDSQAR